MEGKQVVDMKNRILELERKVEQLRVSRRILMNLLERVEREKCTEIAKLQEENRKLQRANQRYAKTIWYRNCAIEPNQQD